MADSEKSCGLMNEFGTVCKRKLLVNVGKSKIKRQERYVNVDKMNARLDGLPECIRGVGLF